MLQDLFNNHNHFIRPVMMMVLIAIMTGYVNTKPQDSNIFENVAGKALAAIGNAAEIIGNPHKMTNTLGFKFPLGGVDSETVVGNGAAFRDDFSEEDKRRRRKRFAYFAYSANDLLGNENLLPMPHIHRDKRSPCHFGGGGGSGTGGTGGGTGGGIPTDGDDLDITERRRRYNAQKRKAASSKKSNTAKKTRKSNSGREKKYLTSDNADQASTRRKRQTEVNDLNQNMPSVSEDFSKYAQQVAEQIHNAMQNLMNSMNNMAQKFKEHFSGQNPTNIEKI